MAQKNVTILIDDLTGKELPDGTGETVSFSLDGTRYELDVDAKGAQKLRSVFSTYVQAGRRLAGRRPATRRVKTAPDPAAIRAWAASNGIEVSSRGRIATSVTQAFEAAGN